MIGAATRGRPCVFDIEQKSRWSHPPTTFRPVSRAWESESPPASAQPNPSSTRSAGRERTSDAASPHPPPRRSDAVTTSGTRSIWSVLNTDSDVRAVVAESASPVGVTRRFLRQRCGHLVAMLAAVGTLRCPRPGRARAEIPYVATRFGSGGLGLGGLRGNSNTVGVNAPCGFESHLRHQCSQRFPGIGLARIVLSKAISCGSR